MNILPPIEKFNSARALRDSFKLSNKRIEEIPKESDYSNEVCNEKLEDREHT
jgi:hypothetical protein